MLINAGPQMDAGGEAWQFVHAFCDEAGADGTEKKAVIRHFLQVKKPVKSAEKSKEAAAREFFAWMNRQF